MKFARYLEETQAPEWKKAYIDYRGLKKRITAIRKAKENRPASPLVDSQVVTVHADGNGELQPSLTVQSQTNVVDHRPLYSEEPAELLNSPIEAPAPAAVVSRGRTRFVDEAPNSEIARADSSPSLISKRKKSLSATARDLGREGEGTRRAEHPRTNTLNMGILPKLRRQSTTRTPMRKGRWELTRGTMDMDKSIPMMELFSMLTTVQKAFFTKLDTELDKVETFYVEREKEMKARVATLKQQLQELKDHRRLYHEAQQTGSWLPIKLPLRHTTAPVPRSRASSISNTRKRRRFRADGSNSPKKDAPSRTDLNKQVEQEVEHLNVSDQSESGGSSSGKKVKSRPNTANSHAPSQSQGQLDLQLKYDPEDYYHAKKKLKKAVLECYRGLEILNNYRTLNMIGFRKALKKFEKIAKMPAQQAYTVEKIEPNTFASSATVQGMLKEIEELYAARFTHGDKKKAIQRLARWRGPPNTSLQLLPFWTTTRFGCTSFGIRYISQLSGTYPRSDPCMGWVAIHLLHLSGTSRIRTSRGVEPASLVPVAYQLRVHLRDQFCSLVFTLSNLFFVACAYSDGLDVDWHKCTSQNRYWGIPFVLASLPLLVRAVQSVKRWFDSRLVTHLINGGKYAMGILYYLFYFNWRHQGAHRGGSFVVWILFGTIYSIYATSWDLLMDWSLLRPHVDPPLLRPELLYRNVVPVYYFAIVSNILIRFIWVLYIPEKGPDFLIRTFIAGMLEAFRRWQWNFFRLENEHLGNMDQYRVTREVPLPYSFDDVVQDSDDEEEGRKSNQSARPWRKSQKNHATDEQGDSSDQTQ
ncbi:hypothetical protein QCA50_010825 [Cerrena zonata]|uniref:Xenotropic and polytropic retrovirus receptor 1 n=1 Tax=Cerrena zonata TaxID=2478898 RepID=A0AAW0G3W0_9APHY